MTHCVSNSTKINRKFPEQSIPPAVFQPFPHPKNAQKSAFLVKSILREIIEISATKCHILKLKCTKFDFGWGSAPDPAGGAYSSPPDPLAGFNGPTSKGREGERGEEKGEGKGREEGARDGEGKGRKGEGGCAQFCIHIWGIEAPGKKYW